MKVDHKISALDRGLTIINFMLFQREPQRFKTIKSLFTKLNDASLTRLLKALVASGYLEQTCKGHYGPGENLQNWQSLLTSEAKSIDSKIGDTVTAIATQSNCSTSFIQLATDHLVFRHTVTLVDSWALGPDGALLCFEPSHAAVIAYLDNVDAESRHQFMTASNYSTFDSFTQYTESLNKFKKEGYYVDQPAHRIGLSRCAVFFDHPKARGAFFIGVSTSEFEQRHDQFVKILQQNCQILLNQLNEN